MERRELILPDLGTGELPITVGVWLARRGQQVSDGEGLVEVVVGSATVDLPSPIDGVLVELLVEEDERIEVGQILAVLEREDW
jgi:pyruvate/2-oxoglutarate dehydrogenase complex dihydrolipoamide acyltransferase (E2) component